jgi:hypothetical protein
MDPNACVKEAIDLLAQGFFVDASFRLEDYAEWRARGGYPAEETLLLRLKAALRPYLKADE